MTRQKFTVSGPGYERAAPSAEQGLSAATTFANQAALRREEATYYVRDAAGEVTGYAESHEDRSVSIRVRGR